MPNTIHKFLKGQTVLFTGILLDIHYANYPVEIHYAYDDFYDIKDELGHIYNMIPVINLMPIPQHTAHFNDVKRITLIRQLELNKKTLIGMVEDIKELTLKYNHKKIQYQNKILNIDKQLNILNKE